MPARASIAHQERACFSNTTAPNYGRPKEAAALLKVHVSTLWVWVKELDGFPQPFKAGTRVTLFDLNAINAWLQNRATGGAQQ